MHRPGRGPQDKTNAEQVLDNLVSKDYERRDLCWRETALKTLRERGQATGLADYFDEVESRLAPIVSGRKRP